MSILVVIKLNQHVLSTKIHLSDLIQLAGQGNHQSNSALGFDHHRNAGTSTDIQGFIFFCFQKASASKLSHSTLLKGNGTLTRL